MSGPSARTATNTEEPWPLGEKGEARVKAFWLGELAGRKAVLSFLVTDDSVGRVDEASGTATNQATRTNHR